MLKKEEHCSGCCYREWHDGDITKCNFLYGDNRCLINEKRVKE